MRVTYEPCEFGPTENAILEIAELVLKGRRARKKAHDNLSKACFKLQKVEDAFTEAALHCPSDPYALLAKAREADAERFRL